MNLDSFDIEGCGLVMTCPMFPEQYDVYKGKRKIGYLRLRHGYFSADYPGVGGQEVYSAEPEGDGSFENHEREYYLTQAVRALKKADKESK